MHTYAVNLSSPMEEIARNIGFRYLLRPFPSRCLNNGLLDYRSLLISTNLARPIHGYQGACRVAALVPVFFEFYKKHIDELPLALQKEIEACTSETLKKIQIVGLMRATGRTQDHGSGRGFAQQGKKECLHYLAEIGIVDADERESLARAIVDLEGGKNQLTLAALLLADATLIETFRDGVSYTQKKVYLNHSPLFEVLSSKKLNSINEWLALASQHATVIQNHQGFILSAFQRKDGIPLSQTWPLDHEIPQGARKRQMELERRSNCYTKCAQDVSKAAAKVLRDGWIPQSNIMTVKELFYDRYWPYQQNNLSMHQNTATFAQGILQFFENSIDEIVTDGEQVFELNWSHVLYYLRILHQYDFPELKPLDLDEIFHSLNKDSYKKDPIFFAEQITEYADKVNAAFYRAGEDKIMPLTWEVMKHLYTKIPEIDTNKLLFQLYQAKVLNKSQTIKQYGGGVRLQFESADHALQAKQFIMSALGLAADLLDDSLILSKEIHESLHYLLRENPENIGNKFVMKAIRADEWDIEKIFLDGILPPGGIPKPHHLRPSPKKKYTVFAEGPVKRKGKAPMYDKQGYSPIQSLTFINEHATTKPFNFHPGKGLAEIGVMIPTSDILVNRYFIKTMGTVRRPLEADTAPQATAIHKKMQGVLYGSSAEETEKFKTIINSTENTNETYARIRIKFNESCQENTYFSIQSWAVFIFGNTLESRLAARHLAAVIKKRLEERKDVLPENFSVPILFYMPGDKIRHLVYYTEWMHQQDQQEAREQYFNMVVRHLNYNNKHYNFLLSLSPDEIVNALQEKRVTGSLSIKKSLLTEFLLTKMIDGGYVAILASLYEKLTDEQKAILLAFSRKNGCVKESSILEVVKRGYVDFARELMGTWQPTTDDFWLPCFERVVHAEVVELIGYEKTLLLLSEAKRWDHVAHILEKIGTTEDHARNSELYGNLIFALLSQEESKHQKKLAKLLLRLGANPNQACTDTGMTPLYIASQNGHLEVVQALLEQGADPNQACTDTGATPLCIASQTGHLKVVQALLEKGADPNQACTDTGATPLFIASQNRHLEVVQALLDKGAYVYLVARLDSDSLRTFAAKERAVVQQRMEELILAQFKSQQTKIFVSPLDIAEVLGYKEIVNCLHNTYSPLEANLGKMRCLATGYRGKNPHSMQQVQEALCEATAAGSRIEQMMSLYRASQILTIDLRKSDYCKENFFSSLGDKTLALCIKAYIEEHAENIEACKEIILQGLRSVKISTSFFGMSKEAIAITEAKQALETAVSHNEIIDILVNLYTTVDCHKVLGHLVTAIQDKPELKSIEFSHYLL